MRPTPRLALRRTFCRSLHDVGGTRQRPFSFPLLAVGKLYGIRIVQVFGGIPRRGPRKYQCFPEQREHEKREAVQVASLCCELFVAL
jgi:hypothetical protein